MRVLFCILLLNLLLTNCKVSANSADSVRNGYSDSVKFVLMNIGSVSDSKKIEYCIPMTRAEAIEYFSYDFKKDFSPAFQELQRKLVQYSANGDVGILKKYLYLSEFVDGYFAEDYFIAIDKIAKYEQAVFCKVLDSCRKENVKRLGDARSKYCN